MNLRAARLTTRVLGGACAALALLAVFQYAGFGRGYSWRGPGEAGEGHAQLADIDRQPVSLPPASAFAAIDEHPLFNEDRAPTPVDDSAAEDAAPPPSPLNIALTGVIVDEQNDVHVAMFLDKGRNQPVALKVGMPLEGDQASWTLVEVKSRSAVFRNSANETSEVELETALAPMAAGRPPAPPSRGRGQPGKPGAAPPMNAPNPKAGDAAADLAKRIEERRRQMREDAEKLRNRNSAPASTKK
jgi:general secretion pathway protein N